MQNIILKIDRIASWILFVVIIIYTITGYGLVKGIIDYDFSRSCHLEYLGAIGLIAFVAHTSFAIHLALRRNKIWNLFSKIGLFVFYAILIGFLLYAHFYYEASIYNKGSENKNIGSENNISNDMNSGENEIVFTAETLKQYNGLNGQPAYVAIDGIVYDVSSLYKNGQHEGCEAGQEVSSEFYEIRRHNGGGVLDMFPVIGTYKD